MEISRVPQRHQTRTRRENQQLPSEFGIRTRSRCVSCSTSALSSTIIQAWRTRLKSPRQPAKAQASGTAPVEPAPTLMDPVSEPGKATTELVEPKRGDGESVGTDDCGEAQGNKGKSPTVLSSVTASRLADTVTSPQHPIPTCSHSPELAPVPSSDTHVAGPHSACYGLYFSFPFVYFLD